MNQFYKASADVCPRMTEVANSTKTAAGCGVSLGIYAKSITPNLGGVAGLQSQKNRADRYELLSVARRVFSAAGKRCRAGLWARLLQDCKVSLHQPRAGRRVYKSNLHKSAFIRACHLRPGLGLPCVRPKDSRTPARRDRQSGAMGIRQRLAACHGHADIPALLLEQAFCALKQQAFALQRLRAGAPWKRFKDDIGYEG